MTWWRLYSNAVMDFHHRLCSDKSLALFFIILKWQKSGEACAYCRLATTPLQHCCSFLRMCPPPEKQKKRSNLWPLDFAVILVPAQCGNSTITLSTLHTPVCHRASWTHYRRPQSFLRMWRILRPRVDFHDLIRLLALIISWPVFRSSWPATTYSDPGEESRA